MSHFGITPRRKLQFNITQKHLLGVVPPNFAENLVLFVIDDPCILAYMGHLMAFGPSKTFAGNEADNTGICPKTPNLNALARNGRIFKWFFAQPNCSPARASLFGSVHVFRHGVSDVVRTTNAGALAEYNDPGFDYSDLSTRLKQNGIRCRFFGKLHQSIPDDEQFVHDPATGTAQWDGRIGSGFGIIGRMGYGQTVAGQPPEYSAVLRNLNQSDGYTPVAGRGYYQWALARSEQGGVPQVITQYNPGILIDELIAFFASKQEGQRLFADFRFNSIHTPYEGVNFPPVAQVATQAYIDANNGLTAWPVPMAGMEALDYHIGRFLASLSPDVRLRTTFVVCEDNGPDEVYFISGRTDWGKDYGDPWNRLIEREVGPSDRMKGSAYRMGSNVPLLWSGPRDAAPTIVNPGGEDELSLIDVVDIPATIAAYFGCPWVDGERDGRSFLLSAWNGDVHTRTKALAENFQPLGDYQAALDREYGFRAKITTPFDGLTGLFSLVRPTIGAADELYQYTTIDGTEVDPWEDVNLASTHPNLLAEMQRLLQELYDSNLGGGGDLFLPFTDRGGTERVIATLEDESIPFGLRAGGTGRFATANGELTFNLRAGGTGRIPLLDQGDAASWALQFRKRYATGPFGYFILLEPSDEMTFGLRGGGTGRFVSVADPPNPNYIPFTLRAGGTGKLNLVTPP